MFDLLKEKDSEIPKMRLYGFRGVFNSYYSESKELVSDWINNNKTGFGNKCIVEYLGNLYDRSDVIRVIYEDRDLLYTAIDQDGYAIYNKNKSVWEYEYGSISDLYSIFRDRGIIFEDDIYKEIEEKNEHIKKKLKEAGYNVF